MPATIPRRSFRPLALVLAALACGGNDRAAQSSDPLANRCAAPRSGTDPITGQRYLDTKGTLDDEKRWLKSYMDALYLWYREIPAADPGQYATMDAYFQALKTPAVTATIDPLTGKPKRKDQFSFTLDTASWEAQSITGVEAGYGIRWVLLARTVPRELVVAQVEPGSPAAAQNVARGAHVLTVDGVSLPDATGQANVDTLNNGLFFLKAGDTHTIGFQDAGSTTTRSVTLTAKDITTTPVGTNGASGPFASTLTTASGTVGYLLFNDHIATSEFQLATAISQLRTAQVTDLVLDMRYNGGGFLDIASELAYMIAGSSRTTGKDFERLQFNDKAPAGTNPVTGGSNAPTPYHSTTQGFSAQSGQALPTLNLPRVFVITSANTCSASESVINGLSGAGVQVNLIGGTTCGKPYGFYPQDNCGTTYFAIQFQGVNAAGFGDYADGFVPAGGGPSGRPGCVVADDFGHALGDPAEARLAAALAFRAGGAAACPPPPATAFVARGRGEGQVVRPAWRENRILRR